MDRSIDGWAGKQTKDSHALASLQHPRNFVKNFVQSNSKDFIMLMAKSETVFFSAIKGTSIYD